MLACCHLRRRQREENRRAGSGSERAERLDVLEFGGIEPNPSYETLMNAVKIAREEKITFLLAVGGGSVLDGTKFIAAAAHYAPISIRGKFSKPTAAKWPAPSRWAPC
jgi:alcohol dehydrogenase YqhD (iron-dependent ADH family)